MAIMIPLTDAGVVSRALLDHPQPLGELVAGLAGAGLEAVDVRAAVVALGDRVQMDDERRLHCAAALPELRALCDEIGTWLDAVGVPSGPSIQARIRSIPAMVRA